MRGSFSPLDPSLLGNIGHREVWNCLYASSQALDPIVSYSVAKVLERNSFDVYNVFCQREKL